MSSIKNKAWFSFAANGSYFGLEPAYFDVSNYDWYDFVVNNTTLFQDEILSKKSTDFTPYTNRTFANEPDKWKFIPLWIWGKKNKGNIKKFPLTESVLNKIPFLVSAAFSQLDSSSNIKPHTGDSNVMFRIHVPLFIPAGLPDCGFEVLGEQKEWVVSEPFAFCDAHKHYAWNNTDEERVVLILDIIRPEFTNKARWICAQVRATLVLQFMFQKSQLMHKLPKFMRVSLMKLGGVFIYPFIGNVN